MSTNVVEYMVGAVSRNPERLALYVPVMDGEQCLAEETITFQELKRLIVGFQLGWKRWGLSRGDRVVLLFRPSVELYAMVISLLASGMVPVFIDTGMSRKKIIMAIEDSKAKIIVSMNRFLRFFWFMPALWRLRRFAVDGIGFGVHPSSKLYQKPSKTDVIHIQEISPADTGLISFTTGSTGRPKGADRTHESLIAQHLIVRKHLPDVDGDIDMTCFPVWVIHNLFCGMTTIMPKVDLSTPASFNANAVIEQIVRYNVTRVSGAPAFIRCLARGVAKKKQPLDRVKRVFTGGATVPNSVLEKLVTAFPNAAVYVLYGSTESEPISSVSARELLDDTSGNEGYLVGYPADGVEVAIALLEPGPQSEADVQKNLRPAFQVGEILVSGSHVLKGYVDNVMATKETKVARADGLVWHRTGDTGYLDEKGRIWLTGRVKDAISKANHWIQPFPLEKKIDELAGVIRSALVQVGDNVILFLQINKPWEEISVQVEHLFSEFPIAPIQFAILESMPVDGRHNSKVDRPLLREQMLNGDIEISGQL